MPNRLPEHRFAYWLLRESINRITGWLPTILHQQPLLSLASFSRNFGQCLRAGLPVTEAFEKCRLALDSKDLKTRWSGGQQRLRRGRTLAESLSDASPVLPAFYLPAVEAGELCGRVDEVFTFLSKHLQLIEPLSKLLRQLWFYPLLIVMFGALLGAIMLTITGDPIGAVLSLADTCLGLLWYFAIAAVVWLTPLRVRFDELRLRLPWVREVEHDLAVCRFFSVMALLEESQSERVDEMIRVAKRTISNQAIANQLEAVISSLRAGQTLGEAFSRATHFDTEVQQTVSTAELSGTLLESYQQLAKWSEDRLFPRLESLQAISSRMVAALVICSLIAQFTSLASF